MNCKARRVQARSEGYARDRDPLLRALRASKSRFAGNASPSSPILSLLVELLAMPVSFLSLPLELMLDIRGHIAESDLRTHACLYLTHQAIAAMYDSVKDADELWASACWSCGIGKLPTEQDRRWRDVAIEVIKKDGFCTNPHCGEALLEHNREYQPAPSTYELELQLRFSYRLRRVHA